MVFYDGSKRRASSNVFFLFLLKHLLHNGFLVKLFFLNFQIIRSQVHSAFIFRHSWRPTVLQIYTVKLRLARNVSERIIWIMPIHYSKSKIMHLNKMSNYYFILVNGNHMIRFRLKIYTETMIMRKYTLRFSRCSTSNAIHFYYPSH